MKLVKLKTDGKFGIAEYCWSDSDNMKLFPTDEDIANKAFSDNKSRKTLDGYYIGTTITDGCYIDGATWMRDEIKAKLGILLAEIVTIIDEYESEEINQSFHQCSKATIKLYEIREKIKQLNKRL